MNKLSLSICFLLLAISLFSTSVFSQSLGVIVDAGKPRIESATTSCFQSSYNGEIKVRVTNEGARATTFETRANCDAPIRVIISGADTFQPGETKTVYIPITGTTTSNQNPSCTVQVVDTTSLKTSEPYTLAACIQATGGCSPTGSTTCENSGIYECQATGQKVLTQNCPFGCKFDLSIADYRCTHQGEVKEEIPSKITTGGGVFTKQNSVIILILLVVLVGSITYLIKKLFKIK